MRLEPFNLGKVIELEKEKIILGIDPGTTIMGYGLIECKGKSISLLTMGILELQKLPDHYLKLQKIFVRTLSLIDEFHPDELAIEAPFYGQNVQSMLKLGRAQGVAMSAALYRGIPIFEYAPRKIKLAITGQGNASKEQVAAFLASTLDIGKIPKMLDATDGLAAAVCHFYQRDYGSGGNSSGGWKDFIKKNPGRVK